MIGGWPRLSAGILRVKSSLLVSLELTTRSILVPRAGFEPARFYPQPPQGCASTNFATAALKVWTPDPDSNRGAAALQAAGLTTHPPGDVLVDPAGASGVIPVKSRELCCKLRVRRYWLRGPEVEPSPSWLMRPAGRPDLAIGWRLTRESNPSESHRQWGLVIS